MMTINEFVCNGIDRLMADAAAQASEFTDASSALAIAFLDAPDTLRRAWHDWLVSEEENDE